MISLQKIIRIYLYFSLPILVITMLLYRFEVITTDMHSSVITAHLMNSGLFFLGHWLNRKGFFKNDRTFLLLVFGGQVLRMFLAFILIIFSLYLLNMSEKNFILVFFLFYFLFLALEIYYLTKIKNFRRP